MRTLAWAAVGFAAAALLAEYLLPVSGLPYIAAALAAVSLFGLLLRKSVRGPVMLVLLAASAGLLGWWFRFDRHVAPCEALAGQTVTIRAEVTDYPVDTGDYTRLEVRIREGAPRETAVLYLHGENRPALTPGDIVETEVRVRSALYSGGERVHFNTAKGANLLGYIQGGVEVVGRAGSGWRYIPKRLSFWIREQCRALFSEDVAPLMEGLLTGDTAALKAETETYGNMRIAGVLHIVAVSGMHIFVLTGFVQLVLGRGRRTSLLCVPLILLFVLMAGATPSAVRAAVMQILFLLAPLLERENDDITTVSAALLVLLLANPMAIGSTGLQLSFACVMGFIYILPPLSRWNRAHLPMKNPAVRFIADSLSCTAAATAFSLPVAACYFGTIPLLSPLANLLTLTVIEICFCGGYIVCILGALLPGAAGVCGWLLNWPARWCLFVYDRIAAVPAACLYTENRAAVWWMASAYGLLLLWFILRRRGIRIRAGIPASLCVIGLCGVLLTEGLSLRQGSGRLAVLDVGQGACVALLDEDTAVLVDCGGSGLNDAGDTAANYLLSAGKSRVDLLVLTHLHEDHTNGVETLLSRMPVEYILLPAGADDGDNTLEKIRSLAAEQGTELIELRQPCAASLGELELSLYLPQAGTDENERGIVVLAEMNGEKALIMGDAGSEAELALLESGLVPDVDVLVAGHHGSKTASGVLFLGAAQAETAIVSVGSNSYGLPAEETMDRLRQYCPQVLRTDEDGTVSVRMRAEEETILYG